MEAFSLLKYWPAGGGGATTNPYSITNKTPTTKTIVALSPYSSDGEDGPYFDLEFSPPDQESDTDEQENDIKRLQTEDYYESESEETSHHNEDEEAQLEFSLTRSDCMDQNAALSPSDDIFFRGNSVSIEPSGIMLNDAEENSRLPIFLVKSATKFRVFLLNLKKPKSLNSENLEKAEKSGEDETVVKVSPPTKTVERESLGKMSGKFFVKFKVEEVPLVNLFARDNSWKENHVKAPKQSVRDSDTSSAAEERKLSKEVVHKYLKMVKPFYIRVSKLKFSGNSGGGSKSCAAASPRNVKSSQLKEGNNLQAGLKEVLKHLGKSRSASAAAAPPAKVVSDHRDDSLLQLQDGIQNAILHCKTSYNASRDVESSSILCRSVSDPSRASSSTSGES